jgi:hypothetical protein
MKKKLVKIFEHWYNVDNVASIEPNYKIDVDTKEKIEIGCTIWYTCSMSNEVFHSIIEFGRKDGKPIHTTAEVIKHLNKGKDLDD